MSRAARAVGPTRTQATGRAILLRLLLVLAVIFGSGLVLAWVTA